MGASFTENADFLSAFPWADGHEAKVRDRPLVLIGDFLSPGGRERDEPHCEETRRELSCRSGRFRSRLPDA